MLMPSRCSVLKLFLLLVLYSFGTVKAEPWLSTRFAQNCAACHAPGRINLEPKDRRCSLSCQGCHVNPNGGGLRSFYGKWNEDRVLRSWVVGSDKSSLHKPGFQKRSKQVYGKKPYTKIPPKKLKSKKFKKFIENEGYPIVTSSSTDVLDKDHDRFENPYHRTAKSLVEFLYQVPDGDPYRETLKTKFDGGSDLRWQYASGSVEVDNAGDVTKTDKDLNFFMTGDFGLRYRPVYRKYHLVYEARMIGNTDESTSVRSTLSRAQTRSLYLMVDELPYNVFVMHGFYKPLFGNYSPDHTLLSQKMLGSAIGLGSVYNSPAFETTSIGTAPNVPYANLHVITGSLNEAIDDYSGLVLNTGLRFVSYSASANYTYWQSEGEISAGNKRSTTAHSLHLAGKLGRFIMNYEFALFEAEQESETATTSLEGNVHFIDLNVQLFKEIYGVFQYSMAGSTESLAEGSATQYKIGSRAFLLPGLEFQLLLENQETKFDGVDQSIVSNFITSQLHMFM